MQESKELERYSAKQRNAKNTEDLRTQNCVTASADNFFPMADVDRKFLTMKMQLFWYLEKLNI
jgi:hypothetical protein